MARPDNALEYSPEGVPYLGSRLRQLRRAAGWTVTDLSKRVGRSAAALSKIETNRARPSRTLLGALSEALHGDRTDLEGTPLHPRLGVSLKQEGPADVSEQEDTRDKEICRLQGEVHQLTAVVDRLVRLLEGTAAKSVAPMPYPAVSASSLSLSSKQVFGFPVLRPMAFFPAELVEPCIIFTDQPVKSNSHGATFFERLEEVQAPREVLVISTVPMEVPIIVGSHNGQERQVYVVYLNDDQDALRDIAAVLKGLAVIYPSLLRDVNESRWCRVNRVIVGENKVEIFLNPGMERACRVRQRELQEEIVKLERRVALIRLDDSRARREVEQQTRIRTHLDRRVARLKCGLHKQVLQIPFGIANAIGTSMVGSGGWSSQL